MVAIKIMMTVLYAIFIKAPTVIHGSDFFSTESVVNSGGKPVLKL